MGKLVLFVMLAVAVMSNLDPLTRVSQSARV